MLPSDVLFPEFPLPWEMSAAERFTLVGLLSRLKPEVAVEIGTHLGGSLQVLAAHCGQVHSIDLDPQVRVQLAPQFPHARFHTGPSHELISPVLAEIHAAAGQLGFILVDGDHTAQGVRADLEALLEYRPRTRLLILMHDSFNPDCRRGLRAVAWGDFPHVHAVDLDFVPGTFHEKPQGGAYARSMWGGFALAVLKPEQRTGPLVIMADAEPLHQIVFRQSAHRIWNKVARTLRRCTWR